MAIDWKTLKDARAIKGWTQAELAEAIAVHPKTIVNWESQGVPPKAEYKLLRVLDDEVSYVIAVNQGIISPAESLDSWKAIRLAQDQAGEELHRSAIAGKYSEEQIAKNEKAAASLYERLLEKAQLDYNLDHGLSGLASYSTSEILTEAIKRLNELNETLSQNDPSNEERFPPS